MKFSSMMYWILIIVQLISFPFVAILHPVADSHFFPFAVKCLSKTFFLTRGRYNDYQSREWARMMLGMNSTGYLATWILRS